jgi:hypothetical protein
LDHARNFLFGVEDVPPVAGHNCHKCGVPLTPENCREHWFSFTRSAMQTYLEPLCDGCAHADDGRELEKAE